MSEATATAPEKSKVRPTIGRVVHVWGPGEHVLSVAEKPYAAIICDVRGDGRVNLVSFNQSGVPVSRLNVPYSETPKAGHWTWPTKEK